MNGRQHQLWVIAALLAGIAFGLGWVGSAMFPGRVREGQSGDQRPLSDATPIGSRDQPEATVDELARVDTETGMRSLPVRRVLGNEAGPFGMLWDLTVVDSRLIVVDWKPLEEEGQILFVDPQSGAVTGSIGPLGSGPGDLQEPVSIQVVEKTNRLWVNDYRNGRMVVYDLAGPKRPLDHVAIRLVPYEAYWSDNVLFATGFVVKELARRYVREGGGVRIDREIGAPVIPTSPENAQYLNRNALALHPSGDRVALGFWFLDLLHIYDQAGRLLHEVRGSSRYVPDVAGDHTEWELQFRELRATRDFLIALFRDREDGESTLASSLRVYSWEGELLGVFRLQTPVHRFAIDHESGTIWGLQSDPHYALIEFEAIPLTRPNSLTERK